MQTTKARIATLALACVLLFSLGGSYALAAQQPEDAGNSKGASKKAGGDTKHKYKGVISAVKGNQIALKGEDGKSKRFTLDSKTKVLGKDKQEGSVSDLKVGMKAKVRTKETSERSEKVKKVRAHTPKKAANSGKASSSRGR